MVRDCRAVSGRVLRRRLLWWPLFSAEQKLDHCLRRSTAAAMTAPIIAIALAILQLLWASKSVSSDCYTFQHVMPVAAHLSAACLITRSSLGGCIKCCTQSVCLSVCPVPSIYSKSESRRNFKFGGGITLDPGNWERKIRGLSALCFL